MPSYVFFIAFFFISHAFAAVPCLKNCVEPFFVGPSAFFTIHSNYSLLERNDDVKHLVIVLQGALRHAHVRYKEASALLTAHEAHASTLLVVPHFKTDEDAHLPTEILWDKEGWKSGGDATNYSFNAFAALDAVIMRALDRRTFPNLTHVSVTGHSAGGQLTQMYALTSPIVDWFPRVKFQFIVMNPSSYVYLDERRPVEKKVLTFRSPALKADGTLRREFSCIKYNNFKFGLDNRSSYSARIANEEIRRRYLLRKVTYALGEADNDPNDAMLNKSCAAMLQGKHRYERGTWYFRYLSTLADPHVHQKISVPDVGHESAAMYNAINVRRALFGFADT